MTVADVRVGMPLDEFLKSSNAQRFEIIDGERIPKLATVAGHSETVDTVADALKAVTTPNNLGMVRQETTYILPDTYDANWVTGARIPDVMFIAAERLEAYRAATPDWRNRPYALVPDLVVEVISPNDFYSQIADKVDTYLADGVRLIWLVDPQRRSVTIHAPNHENPIVLKGEAVLDGGDVIPGFQIVLSNLFA